jgi:subtilisin family serine protease
MFPTSHTPTPLAATHSKVVSPTIDQDMKARGVAQVIVVLAAPPAATAAAAAVPFGDDAAQRVKACFRTSEKSHSSALRQSMVTGGLAAAATVPAEEAAVSYPNLGVMLGSVDTDGLAGLQASDDVAAICGSPPISLIRPEDVAAASLSSNVTWGIQHLGVPRLWKAGLTGKDIRIAHLDTGIDARHPAFKAGALADFAEFELSLGQRITPSPAPHDSDDHGTHTAATIAGRPVAGKHIGVAHGALLHSALVIEGGNVVARVLGGLDWAIGASVRIISLSLGFRGWWEDFIPIVQIIRSRGILPVIAVGNEGPGTSRSPGNYPMALSVGAIDQIPQVASFSSSQTFARPQDGLVPDLVAPGVNVISAAPGKRYQSMSGSSMATPHIAGLAALLWEAQPAATAAAIEHAIFGSCRLLGAMTADRANRGEPDAVDAFMRLTNTALPPDTRQVFVPGAPRTRTTRKTARKTTRGTTRAKTARRRRAAKSRKRKRD